MHISESLVDKKKQKEIYDLNYTVIESIFVDLGVRVVWYENYDDLPGLVAEVFGLSQYQNMDSHQLIALCEHKVDEVQKIEGGLPKFDDNDKAIENTIEFMSYNTQFGKAYRDSVRELKDMLNELSDRIKWDEFNAERIRELQRQVPKYNESISGFGEFFKLWLETVKLFYE